MNCNAVMESYAYILKPDQNLQLRARMKTIERLIGFYPEYARFLRGGTIPDKCLPEYGNLVGEFFRKLKKDFALNSKPLSFTELCSFSTWYTIYPEKVAGKEYLATSRAFPVSVKGSKEDIIRTIQKTISQGKEHRLRISSTKAKAKLKLLKLLKS